MDTEIDNYSAKVICGAEQEFTRSEYTIIPSSEKGMQIGLVTMNKCICTCLVLRILIMYFNYHSYPCVVRNFSKRMIHVIGCIY